MFSVSRIFGKKEKHDGEQQIHQGIFKCKHCDMTFESKERLKKHNNKAHSGKNKK
ncbi:MAG: hypothetical protein WCF06_16550 [Nitrososphaeraceae archaeon]